MANYRIEGAPVKNLMMLGDGVQEAIAHLQELKLVAVGTRCGWNYDRVFALTERGTYYRDSVDASIQ